MKRLLINLTLLAAAALAAGSFAAGGAAAWLLLRRRGRRRQEALARVERELANQRARAAAAERQLAQQAAAPVAPGRGVMANGGFVSIDALRAEADAAAALDATADAQALDELLIENELPLAEVEVLQAGLEASLDDQEPAEIDMAALASRSGVAATLSDAVDTVEDDLIVVDGIGPVFAARLRQHGILTFARLAASNEAELDSIIQAPAWRQPNFAAWIDEAAQLAARHTPPDGVNLP
jgi:predicted flap endonuclease-1-like 5' DNA nuclease